MILGKYRIQYANGAVQYKNLITRDTFRTVIKPLLDQVQACTSKEEIKREELLREIKDTFGEFFVDDSAMGRAISTGFLESPFEGGESVKITLTKL